MENRLLFAGNNLYMPSNRRQIFFVPTPTNITKLYLHILILRNIFAYFWVLSPLLTPYNFVTDKII